MITDLNRMLGWKMWVVFRPFCSTNLNVLQAMDLQGNYIHASTLAIDTLNTVMEADAAIAEKVIAKLGL